MKAMSKPEKIENILNMFEDAANKHAEATTMGDYKTVNKSYTIIANAVSKLKSQNQLESLSLFLDSSSDGVKIWAATHLLPLHEKKAISVLEEIEKQGGIFSLDAETTLDEWRKGTLIL